MIADDGMDLSVCTGSKMLRIYKLAYSIEICLIGSARLLSGNIKLLASNR